MNKSEFYYFDGSKFHRCLCVSDLKDLNNKSDNLFYMDDKKVEELISFERIKRTHFNQLENVENYFFLLTDSGWNLIVVEDMNINSRKMQLIDRVKIDIQQSIKINPTEIKGFNLAVLENKIKTMENIKLENPNEYKVNCFEIIKL